MATLNETFTNIANAIRNKTGDTATMTPAEMVTKINSIQTGVDLDSLTFKIWATPTNYTVEAGGSKTFSTTHETVGRLIIILYSELNQFTIKNAEPIINQNGMYIGEVTETQFIYNNNSGSIDDTVTYSALLISE